MSKRDTVFEFDASLRCLWQTAVATIFPCPGLILQRHRNRSMEHLLTKQARSPNLPAARGVKSQAMRPRRTFRRLLVAAWRNTGGVMSSKEFGR